MKYLNTIPIILFVLNSRLEWTNCAPLVTRSDQNDTLPEKLKAIVNDGTIEIVKKNDQIEYMIGAAKDSIGVSLEELKQFIRETKMIAIEKGVDIDICMTGTIVIDKIDVTDLEKCSYQEELYDLQQQLFDIGNMAVAFAKQTGNISSADDEADLNGVMNGIENDLSILQVKIRDVLSASYATALQCAEAHLSSLDQEIKIISNEFTTCLDAFEIF